MQTPMAPYLAPAPKKKKAKPGYAGVMPAAPAMPGALSGIYGADGEISLPGALSYLDTKSAEAKSANEARYTEGKGILDRSRTEAMGYLEGYGKAAKGDIDRTLQDTLGGIDQDAINRGIYNFTTKDAVGTMARESAGRQKAAVDENAGRLRAEVSSRGYGDLVNFIGSRVDEYPDTGAYLGLIQQSSALKSEREERATERKRLDAERAREEGKRIVHTASDPFTGTVTEHYADGSKKTFNVRDQPSQGSYWFGRA